MAKQKIIGIGILSVLLIIVIVGISLIFKVDTGGDTDGVINVAAMSAVTACGTSYDITTAHPDSYVGKTIKIKGICKYTGDKHYIYFTVNCTCGYPTKYQYYYEMSSGSYPSYGSTKTITGIYTKGAGDYYYIMVNDT